MGRTFDLPELGIFWSDAGTICFAQGNGPSLIEASAAPGRSNTKNTGRHRDVDGSQQQLLVPYLLSSCRWSDPPATAQVPPEGSRRLSRKVRSQPLILRIFLSGWRKRRDRVRYLRNVWHAPFDRGVSIKYRAGWLSDILQTLIGNHTWTILRSDHQLSSRPCHASWPSGLDQLHQSDMEKMFRRIPENHTVWNWASIK